MTKNNHKALENGVDNLIARITEKDFEDRDLMRELIQATCDKLERGKK